MSEKLLSIKIILLPKENNLTNNRLRQLVVKLDNLEEQLTSEEPKENVDASPSTVAQQQQRRDSIISSSAKTQKLGLTLLDELKRVCFARSKFSTHCIFYENSWFLYFDVHIVACMINKNLVQQ